MSYNNDLSRRAFLQRLSVLGAAGLGVGTLLSACGGGEQEAGEAGAGGEAGGTATAAECPGYDVLTEQELQLRTTLGYVDETPYPEKHCSNCRFYNAPTAAGENCGGCQLFKGPVLAGGYCNSWAAQLT